MTDTHRPLLEELHRKGVVATACPQVSSLSGGVSSDILLIDDGRQKVVLKRALPKLRVRDDWFADLSRNAVEQRYLDLAARIVPGATPRVLYRSPSQGFFVMEYLGDEFANWKTQLLQGQADPATAAQAGRILGTIHAHTWRDEQVRVEFDTLHNFRQLRIDPYLVTTAERHPPLAPQLLAIAERLAGTAECLVHGDFSPKNLLVSPGRLVVLDCEAAWFGDPAFDIAFLLKHLLLKSLLWNEPTASQLIELAHTAWSAYRQQLKPEMHSGLEQRLVPLLLALMLARVDGKSPVEYLDAFQQQRVRRFVYEHLPRPPQQLESLLAPWSAAAIQARSASE